MLLSSQIAQMLPSSRPTSNQYGGLAMICVELHAWRNQNTLLYIRKKCDTLAQVVSVSRSPSWNGTDGRLMIRKTPSVTGRYKQPIVQSPFFDVPTVRSLFK